MLNKSKSKNLKEKEPFLKDKDSFLKDLTSFCKQNCMQEFYIFRYQMMVFILLVGETIILGGWDNKILETFHKVLNENLFTMKLLTINDYTYYTSKKAINEGVNEETDQAKKAINEGVNNELDEANKAINEANNAKEYSKSEAIQPRRLRSLGGGLRRLLVIIKEKDKFLTNKRIISELRIFAVLGDLEKLLTQLSAVENNTKFNYQIIVNDISLNNLSIEDFHKLIVKKHAQALEKKKTKRYLLSLFEDLQEEYKNLGINWRWEFL